MKWQRCNHKECNDGFIYYQEIVGGYGFPSVKACPKCNGEMLVKVTK